MPLNKGTKGTHPQVSRTLQSILADYYYPLKVFHAEQQNSLACKLICYLFIIIIIIYSLEFFASVLADGFSLEFEWQQVSSSLQDSSQYSGCSQ